MQTNWAIPVLSVVRGWSRYATLYTYSSSTIIFTIMSILNAFLDSMYGKEVPRKRTISQVDNLVSTSIQTLATSQKRLKIAPSRPLPYILTEREMSLADFQKELNSDKEKLKRSNLAVQSNSSMAEGKAPKETRLLHDGYPNPAVKSESPSGPFFFTPSLPSSANPSPITSFEEEPVHHTPWVPVTDPTRSIPILQVTEPDEVSDGWKYPEFVAVKEEDVVSPGTLLLPSPHSPEVEHCFGNGNSFKDEDFRILSELEDYGVIDAYFD
ncbi:uncharacterized protein MELLADRAFT_102851 [Melampsora larici-populina 98AG31]|uniref:Uncharacterized protein n=1 Tax=Melampsora larici-populina (strain 98AG31 / pathotype 3-4-7) TaxID=747676 RepID=F4R9L5_MELLP|nr:uncharacterized protein MELLADRAFT_102851 [Melampsora larici-populina 98AG31]EGG11128.1 hypothetical protein MELLADRAFT_102851 [Melampsora larici-populina 98AG31]